MSSTPMYAYILEIANVVGGTFMHFKIQKSNFKESQKWAFWPKNGYLRPIWDVNGLREPGKSARSAGFL